MNDTKNRRAGRTRASSRIPLLLLYLGLASLTACGGKEKRPEYYDAVEAPDLAIPQGMSNPLAASALQIAAEPMPPPAYAMETMPPRISSRRRVTASRRR